MKTRLIMTLISTVLIAGIPVSAGPTAQTPAPPPTLEQRVDQLFAEWDRWDSPGAALAVWKDGAVVYKRGYGSAQLEYGIPITPASIFHVASVSKQFTAFAAAFLVGQGKLSWDDPVRKYIPEVPDFGKPVTLRHLVHHTSGLRDQWESLAIAGWRLDDVITKEHILEFVRHQKALNFDPGAEFVYCNTGYTLLAEVVARVTGQPFPKWMEDNVFKPLGMSRTHFHDDHEMIVKDMAYSYAPRDGGGFKKSVLSYANVGATSLFTTVEDMTRWMQNFFEARVGGPGVIAQMQEQGRLTGGKTIDYARGVFIGKHRGLRTVGHGGADAGFRSDVVWFPDQKIGVAVFCNLATMNPGTLSLKVADLYLADKLGPEEATAASPAAAVNPAVYDAYVGKFQIEGMGIVDLVRENDKLFVQVAGQPRIELIPESETLFALKSLPAKVAFEPNKAGRVNRFALRASGLEMPAKRIEPPALKPEELAAYAGNYYSEELDVTYTLAVAGGRLVVRQRRNGEAELVPTEKDTFAGNRIFFGSAAFTRDKGGRITGFLLSGSRVRNIRFDKK